MSKQVNRKKKTCNIHSRILNWQLAQEEAILTSVTLVVHIGGKNKLELRICLWLVLLQDENCDDIDDIVSCLFLVVVEG